MILGKAVEEIGLLTSAKVTEKKSVHFLSHFVNYPGDSQPVLHWSRKKIRFQN